MKNLKHLRVAIVHDWLTVYAGAESVLESMLEILPQADLFCIVDFLPKTRRKFLEGRNVATTFIQRMPGARKYYRHYLPLMPLAVEQFDLSGYDLVISSSHAVAKGVLTGPDQLHLCMCYSPIRYAWDLQHQYLRDSNLDRGWKSMLARLMLHRVRLWDYRTANGVDRFIAISEFIQRRIRKVYGRGSTVISPPVDTNYFVPGDQCREGFYLTASRMVPYKKIDLIVEAFRAVPDKRLIVIGDGPDFKKISRIAGGNVELVGALPRDQLRSHLQRARAFLFAAEEDFGILPLEAQACGTPVIACAKGALNETVVDGVTGVLASAQTVEAILEALVKFEDKSNTFQVEAIRGHALNFSKARFIDYFSRFVIGAVDTDFGYKNLGAKKDELP